MLPIDNYNFALSRQLFKQIFYVFLNRKFKMKNKSNDSIWNAKSDITQSAIKNLTFEKL